MTKLLTIARNTFTETIRQPIFTIIIVVALLLIAISPSITMYTLSDDNKLLREIGLSTLVLTSLFIAVFAASGAVGEEIENKTILTVMTKPVPRPIFIIAKYLGVAAAVALAHYICSIGLLIAIRHGVLEAVSDPRDWTAIIAAVGIAAGALLLSAFFNYVYDWKFSSTAVILTAIFGTIAIIFLALVDRNWQFNPAENKISMVDIYGAILLYMVAAIIAALAVALSTRFNIVVTLSACVGLFLIGLISDYTFGRFADVHLWAQIGRYIVPNIQIFWISDAIYEGSHVPIKYVAIGGFYAFCYTAGILSLAVALFQRRQVG